MSCVLGTAELRSTKTKRVSSRAFTQPFAHSRHGNIVTKKLTCYFLRCETLLFCMSDVLRLGTWSATCKMCFARLFAAPAPHLDYKHHQAAALVVEVEVKMTMTMTMTMMMMMMMIQKNDAAGTW